MDKILRVFWRLVELIYRRRSPALYTMSGGLLLIGLCFGAGWVLDIDLPIKEGKFSFKLSTAEGMPEVILTITFLLGIVLVVIGLAWAIYMYIQELEERARKKLIVMEVRGLRDTSGTPLVQAVPRELTSQKESVLFDLRQYIVDGVISDPEAAMNKLVTLTRSIESRVEGLDRNDITYIYAGLAPVPLTFLHGILMDDEGKIMLMDWDRHTGNWKQIDGLDDQDRFTIDGLDSIGQNQESVALVVSVSYKINLSDVRSKVGDIPIVQMNMNTMTTDNHWSEDKQKALGEQFLRTAIAIGNLGVNQIHLFLAGANSIVFRFGRLYDKRNLPKVTVYQYQRGAEPVYPWGVQMPVAGLHTSQVVR